MFCSTLQVANKIIKSVFTLEIQIFIKNHPLPTPPTKVKVTQQLCTQYRTFRQKIPSAANDLAPQTETTTVCLVFCINPSSMGLTPAIHLNLQVFLCKWTTRDSVNQG